MSEIDRRGIEPVVTEALERAAGAPFVHMSLDMDALDPEVAPGVGTAVRGGLSYREAHLAMELVAESGLLGSFEIVEVNPILDRENATAALAVELAASAGAASCSRGARCGVARVVRSRRMASCGAYGRIEGKEGGGSRRACRPAGVGVRGAEFVRASSVFRNAFRRRPGGGGRSSASHG